MLIVRDLGIEIGARRILDPVSFTVGNGEKVGLVGRNGAGKSTLLSVLLGYTPEHLRISGNVQHQGRLSHLPQEPVPGGLGVEPSGSRTCSRRADSTNSTPTCSTRVTRSRRTRPRRPSSASPSSRRQFRERGGYEAESEVSRLAGGSRTRRRTSCSRTSTRSRGVSDDESTSCACSTNSPRRWCSTNRRTTSTRRRNGGSSTSSIASAARCS